MPMPPPQPEGVLDQVILGLLIERAASIAAGN
jgi:hypothetical protein